MQYLLCKYIKVWNPFPKILFKTVSQRLEDERELES